MYKCSGEFAACDGSGNGWFKIDEAGFHPASGIFLDTEVNSGWDIAKLVGGNKGWTSTIPAGLAPGNYLVRHELIALHQAKAPQWYAECAQLAVGGSGTASPSSSQLAAIPGYAKQSDPNISVSESFAPQVLFSRRKQFTENYAFSSTSTTTVAPRLTRFLVLLSSRARAPRRPGTSPHNLCHSPRYCASENCVIGYSSCKYRRWVRRFIW